PACREAVAAARYAIGKLHRKVTAVPESPITAIAFYVQAIGRIFFHRPGGNRPAHLDWSGGCRKRINGMNLGIFNDGLWIRLIISDAVGRLGNALGSFSVLARNGTRRKFLVTVVQGGAGYTFGNRHFDMDLTAVVH